MCCVQYYEIHAITIPALFYRGEKSLAQWRNLSGATWLHTGGAHLSQAGWLQSPFSLPLVHTGSKCDREKKSYSKWEGVKCLKRKRRKSRTRSGGPGSLTPSRQDRPPWHSALWADICRGEGVCHGLLEEPVPSRRCKLQRELWKTFPWEGFLCSSALASSLSVNPTPSFSIVLLSSVLFSPLLFLLLSRPVMSSSLQPHGL